LTVASLGGKFTQQANTALNITGTSSLTADNGVNGAGDVKYKITLAQAGDTFGGTVTAEGSAITLKDNKALKAILDSSGATSLTAAGHCMCRDQSA
jgi:hypothetical protein